MVGKKGREKKCLGERESTKEVVGRREGWQGGREKEEKGSRAAGREAY